jgi:sugar lactone lactonase YvrE
MRENFLAFALVAALPASVFGQSRSDQLISGLKNPTAATVDPEGRIYIAECGEHGKQSAGAILRLEPGKAVSITSGMQAPLGMVYHKGAIYVTDKDCVYRIEPTGKRTLFVGPSAFPEWPRSLNAFAVDAETGTFYVTDAGFNTGGGLVFRITAAGEVSVLHKPDRRPTLPDSLLMDGRSHLLMVDAQSRELYRIKLEDGSTERIARNCGRGLARDVQGRLFVNSWNNKNIRSIPRSSEKEVVVGPDFVFAHHFAYDPVKNRLIVPDSESGTVTAVSLPAPDEKK